jgi:PEGA domain
MGILGRFFFPAWAGVLAIVFLSPVGRAESLSITSAPAGANVEIDGALVGTTPFHTDYPGGYFHKTHTVFGSRLEHAMTLRVSKDGYAAQQITITDGPFDWIAVSGKRHGNYFVLKSDHFDMKLTAGAEIASTTWAGDARMGPMHPHAVVATALSDDGEKARGVGTLAIASDPAGAEVYVDGHFVGQTPATLHLASGAHRIELRASGKRDWSRELEVIKDSEVTVRPVMERVQ